MQKREKRGYIVLLLIPILLILSWVAYNVVQSNVREAKKAAYKESLKDATPFEIVEAYIDAYREEDAIKLAATRVDGIIYVINTEGYYPVAFSNLTIDENRTKVAQSKNLMETYEDVVVLFADAHFNQPEGEPNLDDVVSGVNITLVKPYDSGWLIDSVELIKG